MGIALAIVFALVFAGVDDDLAPLGALVGYVLGRWITERAFRRRLEERLSAIEGRLGALEMRPSAEARKPTAEDRVPLTEDREPRTENREPTTEDRGGTTEGPSTAARAPIPAQDISPLTVQPEPVTHEPLPVVPAPPPPEPNLADQLLGAIRAYLFGGNTVVRVGVIVMLFGVAFLVKYAADNDYFPVEARLVAATLLGAALLIFGWRLRTRRLAYAVSLQGGGIGVIYLVVFAAFRIYELLPQPAAFALLVVLGATTAVLAVLQDALGLACLGVVGGFLAPVLVSTGQGSHVVLFSYYAVINAGLVVIAWFKSWRVLNLLGFFFTFFIATSWGVTRYTPEHYASAQAFLALFFVFYGTISILFAWRQGARLRGFIDGTLVFGLPLVAFSLQAGLVADIPYGLAWSSAAVALYYVLVATLLYKRAPEQLRALTEAFLALGVGFVTLTIPFALSGKWAGASWALEGAGLVWIGKRQSRRLPRYTGVLLQLAAAIIFWAQDTEPGPPLANAFHLGALLIAAGGLASAYFLQREPSRPLERSASVVLLGWGLAWHVVAGASELVDRLPLSRALPAIVALLAGTALAADLVGRRLAWTHLRWSALTLGPGMLALVAAQLDARQPPLEGWSAAAWVTALAAWLFVLRRQEQDTPRNALGLAHALTAPILAILGSEQLGRTLREHAGSRDPTWEAVGVGLAPAAVLIGLSALGRRRLWPVAGFERPQLLGAGGVLAAGLVLWTLAASFSVPGDPHPLPYLPLINPLDLTQGVIIVAWLALYASARHAGALGPSARVPFWSTLAVLVFVFVSAIVARSVHHFAGVAFDADAMFDSVVLQSSLSITWTIIALAVTAFASRKGWRPVWFAGGVLLGVVVVKLFVIDLSSIGTVGRIVSFLVVGLLLLLIGWISPVPPRQSPAGASS